MNARRSPALASLTALLVAAAVGAAVTPGADARSAAHAGPAARGGPTAGDPVPVSTGPVSLTDQPGLHRTADGTLHVSYVRDLGPTDRAAHVAVDRTGRVVRRSDVTDPWTFVHRTDLAPTPGGMRLVVSGYDDSPSYFGVGGTYNAVGDGSGSWTMPQEGLAKTEGRDLDTVTLADGTPVTAVQTPTGFAWRVGTFTGREVDAPDDRHQDHPGATVYHVALARSGDQVHAAWNTLRSGPGHGAFVRRLHPTPGPVLAAPGSAPGTDAGGSDNRAALATSTTGELYLAYCAGTDAGDCDRVALWNVGTGRVTAVPASRDARSITLSAAPGGRMWVTWKAAYGELRGARSNPAGTRVGAPSVRRFSAAWGNFPHSAAESSLGFADVVLNNGRGHHLARLLPALTVKAAPQRWRAGRRQAVRVSVTDAGDAVRGVRVRVAGDRCTTRGSGRCTVQLAPRRPGRVGLKATRSGYAPSVATLRVRR